MSAACSTCGCSTPVLPTGRCIICEGAFQCGLRAGLAMAAEEAERRAQTAERARDECIAKGREVMAEYHDGANQMGASLAQWMREAVKR